MKIKTVLISLIFIAVSLVFFYPIFSNKIPFPGDLLVGEYAPYNSYNFLGYAPGGYPNKGQDFDVLRLLYPEKEFSIQTLKSFKLPLWNPYNFSGNPHLASLQSGSFYPLNIVFFLFSYVPAWTIFILLQPVLTGIFTFLFVRELKLNIKSSIFSGLIFAFSSYSIVWMEYGNIGHSILWMPFALLLVLKNVRKPTILKSIIISLSLTLAVLAGYIQTAFYLFVFVFGFAVFNILFVDRQDKLKKFSIFLLIFFIPILLSAFQLLPMLELISQSARTPYPHSSFLKLLIPPYHGITMLVPDFFGNPATRNYWLTGTYIERVMYIGVVPLIFIIYAFLKKQSAQFWFFTTIAVIVLLLTFKNYLSPVIYFFQIPLISTAVPTRMMFLFCFCISIIAGFGLEAFINSPNKKLALKITCFLGGIYVLTWLFVYLMPIFGRNISWINYLSISKRNLLLPSGIFFVGITALWISLYLEKYRKYIILFLLALSLADLFYFLHKITPFAPKETVYPPTEVLNQLKRIQGIDRSWGYGNGYVSTNLQTHEKIFSVDGYNALHLKRYGELISSSKDGKIENSISGSDVVITSGYGGSDLRENRYRQRLLDLMGVKYILNKNDFLGNNDSPDYNTFPGQIYKLVWQKAPWQIYENKQVLPRIFLASSYVVEKDKNKIIQLIFDEKFDFRNKLILEEPIAPLFDFSSDNNARVEIRKYSPNEIILKTSTAVSMILFVSDNYYPGWKVSIDGRNDKIYRADYSFRAVPVPKGIHEIKFWYGPASFRLGLWISAVSFSGALLILSLFGRRGKSDVK